MVSRSCATIWPVRSGAHFRREIEFRLAAAVLLRPVERGGRKFCGDGNVDLLVAEAEHGRFDGDGQLDHGIVGMNRVGELLVARFFFKMLEIARGVVAVAVADLHAGRIDLHAHRVPGAVVLHIRVEVVAHEIVAAIVLLNFRERVAQVAQIEEGAPAGVRRERGQRVARIFALVGLMEYGSAGEHGRAGGGVGGHVAARERSPIKPRESME